MPVNTSPLTRRPIIFTEINEDPSAPQVKCKEEVLVENSLRRVNSHKAYPVTTEPIKALPSTNAAETHTETPQVITTLTGVEEIVENVKDITTIMDPTSTDITTIMDPTSIKEIKIRISKMPPLPRSPRRLCTTRLPLVPRQSTPPGAAF